MTFLQLCPIIHSSLNKADDCEQWPGKKIKLEEEAISEILVADINSESGAEASDIEDYFEEEEEQQQQQQASAEVAITNTGQRNHQSSCAAICVLLVAKERAQCVSVQDVTWACAWYLVSRNITQK
jgi:ethanolamine ammonia-lyase small subunit